MEVYYNNKLIKDNDFLRVTDVQEEPKIELNIIPNELYTLILYDPDAVGGTMIHWAIVNITNNDIKTGNIIIPYKGPAPPPKSGKHRYIFNLYEQDRDIFIEPMNERQMELDKLEDKLKLSDPFFNIKFVSENEIGGKKRKRKTKRRRNKRFKKTRRY
jgi:hypothetical protein